MVNVSAGSRARLLRVIGGGVGALAVAAGAVLLRQSGGRPPVAAGTGAVASDRPATFVDVASSVGLSFRHSHGGCGGKAFVEQIASGCAFLDYDGDGWQDILLLRGAPMPRCPEPRTRSSSVTLYRNDRGRRFLDVTRKAGLEVSGYALGCCAGDYDNDGRIDLYVTCWGRNYLFQNRGVRPFAERGRETGVANRGMSTSCAWFDYDRDGWLDLYVCRYVRWDPGHDLWCGPPDRKAYCPPAHYPAEANLLYRNNRNGTFTDVTTAAGVAAPGGKSLGVATADVDDDGWPDLFVVNDGTPNFLFRNRRDGTFEDISIRTGIAVPETATPKGGMGIDFTDLDGSGSPSFVIGNLHHESLTLFRNTGRGYFEDAAFRLGLGEPSASSLTWGTFFLDANLDGLADVFAANGHIQENIAETDPQVSYRQRPLLFERRADGGFQEVGALRGFRKPLTARGAAWGDCDNDGRPEILINNNHQRPSLYSERMSRPSDGWLKLRLVGTRSNRSGIGARVTLEASGRRQVDWVRSGSSYCSQSDLRLNFGLGGARVVDRIRLRWPSGVEQTLERLDPRQTLTVVEPWRGHG